MIPLDKFDLCITACNLKTILDELIQKYGYKLKGVGPLEFHLGCDFSRDPDGTLCFDPIKYIQKILNVFENMFKEKPRPNSSPLEKNDHPELDDSEEVDAEMITQYQSMIGVLQWVVSLGRFDICTAIMMMSHFHVAPLKGHVSQVKRIYGYLAKNPGGVICVRTEEPDYSDVEDIEYEWEYSVYGHVSELIADDIPPPLGKEVVTTTYVDANLYHDLITGRAATGILHLVNGTPIDWYSKCQATVETATYGSEFVAARIATDQVIDLHNMLCYLGVLS